MFLINSPPHVIRCDLTLLQGRAYCKLRPAFLPSSLVISCLDCLGILYHPTCVWSEYELYKDKFRGFSWHQNYENHSSRGNHSWSSLFIMMTDLPIITFWPKPEHVTLSTYILSTLSHIPMCYPITLYIRAGILTSNPSTPRVRVSLRSRLTLRRWTLRRKP